MPRGKRRQSPYRSRVDHIVEKMEPFWDGEMSVGQYLNHLSKKGRAWEYTRIYRGGQLLPHYSSVKEGEKIQLGN
jgi:hypothetical protein